MLKYLIVALNIFLFTNSFAQSNIFTPLNFIRSVEKGTRTMDGNPGSAYWQNSTDYFIKARIHPKERLLEGSEKIIYYNNSPDSLKVIYIRLYQNIQRPNAPRDGQFDKASITEGVIISSLKVAGEDYDINNRDMVNEYATNFMIRLKNVLPPSSKIEIDIEWHFEIPKSTWRMGYYDSTSAFIAYWYPQVSVYDDIDGWDINVYKGYAEMYNDFNNYEVELTVPQNFGLWATGVFKNPQEILNTEYYERYKKALSSDDVVNVITKNDLIKGNIFQNKPELTYRFVAEKTPDFAFGFSDHYLWDAVNLKLKNGKNVYVAAAYKQQSEDFYQVTQIAKESLKYFSEEMPAVPYPYPSATVFNGSGGMEFPMIINNGSMSTYEGAAGLASHELLHQYFPFYMGTNEKKYAWMDEGWAVMLPFDYQDRNHHFRRAATIRSYESIAGTEDDIPPIVPSIHLTGTPYRNAAYNRSGLAYMYLRDFMGDELFLKALQEYMRRWNGKHPLPNDFFFTFNEVAGEDLSWFWNPWFFNFSYPDLAIKEVKNDGEKLFVTIKKAGAVPVPVQVKFIYDAEWDETIYKDASIWKDGRDEIVVEFRLTEEADVRKIELGSNLIPDTNKSNNDYLLSK